MALEQSRSLVNYSSSIGENELMPSTLYNTLIFGIIPFLLLQVTYQHLKSLTSWIAESSEVRKPHLLPLQRVEQLAWVPMAARAAGEENQAGMEIQDLVTARIMGGIVLIRMETDIILTTITEMAYHLHPPLKGVGLHGEGMSAQIRDSLQDRPQSLQVTFLMTVRDLMAAKDIDPAREISNVLYPGVEAADLMLTPIYQAMVQTQADLQERTGQEDEMTGMIADMEIGIEIEIG